MIISRYFTKEILATLLGVTSVLLLIFLSNALVRFLSYAASGKLGAHILLQLLGFETPYLLALLLPLGLYLGIILAYGRMYADSELRVLHACGLSVGRLVSLTSLLIIIISMVVLLLTLWVNPWLSVQKEKLIADSLTTSNILDNLMPGRFQVSSDGKHVLYVESVERKHKKANNLFIADQRKKSEDNHVWTIVSAAQGAQILDPKTQDRFIVAKEGNRYEGMPGENNFKITQFKKYSIRVPQTTFITKRSRQESKPTALLLKNYQDPENAAELQWRLSIPLSAFILSLLAIPLSHIPPRRGRYLQLIPGILIYVIYVNLLFVARHWIEQRFMPISIGMWGVHAFFLLMALFLIMMRSGWHMKRWLRVSA